MDETLDVMRKGNVLAAIDHLSRALAFPETGGIGYRLAAIQLVAPDRDKLVAELKEYLGNGEAAAERIVDFFLRSIGR